MANQFATDVLHLSQEQANHAELVLGTWLASETATVLSGPRLGNNQRYNIYGEGEAKGFTDIAVDPRFSEGRPLSNVFRTGSASEIIINNSPIKQAEINEIIRLSRSGTTVTFSAPESKMFSTLSEGLKGRATIISETSKTMFQGTDHEYIFKTVKYRMN